MSKAQKILLLAAVLASSSAALAKSEFIRPDKIVMLWDYIGRKGENLRPEKRIVHRGLDVVSPTWFSLRNPRGDVSSLADKEYVRWAHENGIKVWALFENSSNGTLTFRALMNNDSRKRIIEQIAEYALEYSLDGINIDFEALRANTGVYFEMFIEELYEKLKPMGITLSVDIPLPLRGSRGVYGLANIAENSDYIVVMAYDQHHVGSETPGPVAEINWVKQGIDETLRHVPPGKVILGIPFYTRIWVESIRGGSSGFRSELKGMKEAFELFSLSGSEWERDAETGQIYSEYTEGRNRHRAWLEDEHSLSLKLDAIVDYNLAGMSAWRRGWEWEETWDMVDAYFE